MNATPIPPRWALVTGASAGIGAAIARELAARGVSVVLTARRLERLQSLAQELATQHGVRAETIAADLADASAPRVLCEEISRRGIAIDMLVNNAGYGVPGFLHTQPWQAHADFLQVLVTAPVELCYRLVPAMRAASFGRIVNVASLAGHLPGSTGHTLYAASKAFLVKFSQSLALENRAHGVNVCALCPGFTYSEFHDVTGARELVSKMPRWMWMDARDVARQAIDAVERGEIVYVTGRVNRLIKFFAKHLPDRLALNLIARRSKDFRLQKQG